MNKQIKKIETADIMTSDKTTEITKETTMQVKLDPSTPPISSIVRIVIVVLAVMFLVNLATTIFVAIEGLIILVILATFFAYLLAPLVDLLEKLFAERGRESFMPRWAAIALVYLGVFFVLYLAIGYLAPRVSEQAREFASQVPEYGKKIQAGGEQLNERYQNSTISPEVKKAIEEKAGELIGTVGEYATAGISALLVTLALYLPWAILIPIFGFFLLKDGAEFKNDLLVMFPTGEPRKKAESFLFDINLALAAYTRAQLISCLLIGTVCGVAFYILGVRYALLLGILAGIFEFIPLVGPLVLAVIAITISCFYSFSQGGSVAIFLLILRIVHDYVTYPRIVRQGIHLHPLAVILAVLAGGEIGGIVGIFLAIPAVAIATVIYKHLLSTRQSSQVVAEVFEMETVTTKEHSETKPVEGKS